MVKILKLFLLSIPLFAYENPDFSLQSTLNTSYTSTLTTTVLIDAGVVQTIGDNFFGSLFAKGLYSSDESLRSAKLSDLNVGYLNDNLIATVGRMDVGYDWLMGSVDMLNIGYNNGGFSTKLFYATTYTDVGLYYFQDTIALNGSYGMVGAMASYEGVAIYDYYFPALRNLAGLKMSLPLGDFRFETDGAYLSALENELLSGDEWYLQALGGYFGEFFTLYVGAKQNGSNGLMKFYDFGVGGFEDFYLGNNNYLGDVTSYYVGSGVVLDAFSIGYLGGKSISTAIDSIEHDVTLEIALGDAWSLNAGYYLMLEPAMSYQFNLALSYTYD